jgi:hypothetical protein
MIETRETYRPCVCFGNPPCQGMNAIRHICTRSWWWCRQEYSCQSPISPTIMHLLKRQWYWVPRQPCFHKGTWKENKDTASQLFLQTTCCHVSLHMLVYSKFTLDTGKSIPRKRGKTISKWTCEKRHSLEPEKDEATYFAHASPSVGTPHDWLLSPPQCQGPAF